MGYHTEKGKGYMSGLVSLCKKWKGLKLAIPIGIPTPMNSPLCSVNPTKSMVFPNAIPGHRSKSDPGTKGLSEVMVVEEMGV